MKAIFLIGHTTQIVTAMSQLKVSDLPYVKHILVSNLILQHMNQKRKLKYFQRGLTCTKKENILHLQESYLGFIRGLAKAITIKSQINLQS